MVYIVIKGCKDPYTAEISTLMSGDENDVYINKRDADNFAQQLNDVDGEGSARVVAL